MARFSGAFLEFINLNLNDNDYHSCIILINGYNTVSAF